MQQIRKKILNWYKENKRDLPWRGSIDPYIIWLTEIIMQQTRIEQGSPYFQKFLQKYPNIFLFAKASEHDILKIWQGLGYYSRARNMHYTAKKVVVNYQGKFPADYKELMTFKGIGDYTASMILSVCFHKPYAVVDGNVFRVLSRIFGVREEMKTDNDIWKNLYEFPLIETNIKEKINRKKIEKAFKIEQFEFKFVQNTKHILSHQVLDIDFYFIELKNFIKIKTKGTIKIGVGKINNYAIPKPIETFINLLNHSV